MAIRPDDVPFLDWSVDELYTNGPVIVQGTPTKVTPGAAADEGAIVEAQLEAQFYNFMLNQFTTWLRYFKDEQAGARAALLNFTTRGRPQFLVTSSEELLWFGNGFLSSSGFGVPQISGNGIAWIVATGTFDQNDGLIQEMAFDGAGTIVGVGSNQTGDGSIFTSADDGQTWADIADLATVRLDFPDGGVASFGGGRFIVGGRDIGGLGVFYTSTDPAVSWTVMVNQPISSPDNGSDTDPVTGDTLVALATAISITNDFGATAWSFLFVDDFGGTAIVLLDVSWNVRLDQWVVVGSSDGVPAVWTIDRQSQLNDLSQRFTDLPGTDGTGSFQKVVSLGDAWVIVDGDNALWAMRSRAGFFIVEPIFGTRRQLGSTLQTTEQQVIFEADPGPDGTGGAMMVSGVYIE